MFVLRIEHSVPNYEGWKKAFDSDPIDRQKSGVRNHRISRAIDDPNHIIIELEFDTVQQAEATLAALQEVWGRVEGKIMMNAQTRIIETVETKSYPPQ